MKKLFTLLTVLGLGISVIGCGEGEKKKDTTKPSTPATEPAKPAEPAK